MAADRDVLAELGRRVRERETQLQTHADPTRGPSRARQRPHAQDQRVVEVVARRG